MENLLQSLQTQFYITFIEGDRWRIYFLSGLINTIKITIGALIIGVLIGGLIALVRTAYDSEKKHFVGLKGWLLGILNCICKVYLTVIRGTPSTVQLLIMYFIIFANVNKPIYVATLAFGVNSGAYVAEIIRAGIQSVPRGQVEAGRSLGLNYSQTMRKIVLPQAVKNVLPSLGNELIVLLKETSICTVIGLMDLTKGAMVVQSRTFAPWMPYLSIALAYLLMVMGLSFVFGRLERRMRKSDKR